MFRASGLLLHFLNDNNATLVCNLIIRSFSLKSFRNILVLLTAFRIMFKQVKWVFLFHLIFPWKSLTVFNSEVWCLRIVNCVISLRTVCLSIASRF